MTDEEIEAVCRDANIWDFIQSLPDRLETQGRSIPRYLLLSSRLIHVQQLVAKELNSREGKIHPLPGLTTLLTVHTL